MPKADLRILSHPLCPYSKSALGIAEFSYAQIRNQLWAERNPAMPRAEIYEKHYQICPKPAQNLPTLETPPQKAPESAQNLPKTCPKPAQGPAQSRRSRVASLALLQEVTFYIEGDAKPHILHWGKDIGNKDVAKMRPETSGKDTGKDVGKKTPKQDIRKRTPEKSARLIEIPL